MAASGPSVNGSGEVAAPVSSATESINDDLKLLRESVGTLPRQPIRDLMSNSVCARCICRLFSLHGQICSHPSWATSSLSTVLNEIIDSEGEEANILRDTENQCNSASIVDIKEESKYCSLCRGILQFKYEDSRGIFVKKDCPDEFTAATADLIKQEGHQFDNFSLEVSLPQDVVENEMAVWSYMKEKYSSESWFLETLPSESISIKDFLKSSVANPLEMLLGVKSNVDSSFRVRLTYSSSEASTKNQHGKDNGFNKRRKIDGNDDLKRPSSCKKVGGHDITKNSEGDVAGFSKFPLDKVNQCCSLIIQCYRTSIYIGGRYLKYSRNVSQTRWIIDDERKGEASIEEIVGGTILPMCQGDNYKFHAAGREDIDVRMLGTGRPFLVEIQNARIFPTDVSLKDMEKEINGLESQHVRVKNLVILGNQGMDLMREGESEKQKQYAALVWISRPLEDEDVQALSSVKDMQISQKTPIRVLHRRSPLEREKTIHWMRTEEVTGSAQYFLLHLCTQAGTYIKEFVHGDLGRTHPSVGSILKCRAEILRLDVTDVKMDWFEE